MDALKENGFTLLEIALVMVLIGLVAGGGISLLSIHSKRNARNGTIDYLNQAKAALVSFANINGRLPWADTSGDGNEDASDTFGSLPFQTLRISPADPNDRALGYELNTNLGLNRPTSCNTLRLGLAGRPNVVDIDGSPVAFPIAAILISAGPMDADSNGNVFDDINAGTHQGDNTDGNPNYLRHTPLENTFDDLVVYLGENELYGEICGNPLLTVRNTSLPLVYVYDQSLGVDVGIVVNGDTETYDIISGSQIELRDAPAGGGALVGSTPATPIVLAGTGRSLTIP